MSRQSLARRPDGWQPRWTCAKTEALVPSHSGEGLDIGADCECDPPMDIAKLILDFVRAGTLWSSNCDSECRIALTS